MEGMKVKVGKRHGETRKKVVQKSRHRFDSAGDTLLKVFCNNSIG